MVIETTNGYVFHIERRENMKYYDQHLHTFLSFDSKESFEAYLDKGLEIFVATDHFDLQNPCSQFKDDIPDYEQLVLIHRKLTEKYPTKLLKGIEIGVVPGQQATIETYLQTHPYDLHLLSIHQNGQFDYMDDVVLTMDKLKTAQMYFDQMELVLQNFKYGHILTHFEYGLRRLSFSAEELANHFETQLTRILKLVIQRQMGLELNAKSFGKYQNAPLYDYIIPLYQSLGGKLFTLGSDAHVAKDYQLLFPEMAQLLAKHQVKQLALFENTEIQLVSLI